MNQYPPVVYHGGWMNRNPGLGLLRTGTKSKIFELKRTLELGTNQKLTVEFGPGYLKLGV
jgi:hypothetical protein